MSASYINEKPIRKETSIMRLFEKLIYSLFSDLTSETEQREWALAILGFSFLDEINLEDSDETENIEAVEAEKESLRERTF